MNKSKSRKQQNKNNKKTASKNNKSGPLSKVFNIIGTGLPPGMKTLQSSSYSFDQTITGVANLVSSTVAEVSAAYSFTFNALPQYATIASLFDQYRIDTVEFWLIPQQSDNTNCYNPGLLTSVIDFDDDAALTSQNLAEYQNAIVTSGLDGHYRRFKPHCAMDLYNGSFSAFGNVTSPWIDAASPSVRHYGVKVAITTTSSVLKYDTRVRLHLTVKNVH